MCDTPTAPFVCVRFFAISATPIGLPLDAAGPRPQLGLFRSIARLRIAPLHDEPGHRAVEALAVVEAALRPARRCARTVCGASSGYVSNANVPLDVSTTITRPGCA